MRLNSADLINVGYMAGRYGVSLDGDLSRNYQPVPVQGGVCVNINSCTKPLFEQNLVNAGIKFNVIA